MKRFIFTESQWCRLNEGRARKPQINMDVELPKQGRVAVKITPKEFEEKMHAIWDKHIENTYGKFTPSNFVYRFCRQHLDFEEMKAVRDDLAKIQHNEENLDAIGKIESSNGLTYLKCDVGGDWEAPMLFFLYWDGNKFRAYIPTYGNAFNRSTKTAFGNNDEEDLKFLKSQNPDFSDEELRKFIHNVGYNVDACLKDFKARVTVKKSNVNENIGDVKKIHLTESQYNFLLESVLLLEMSLSGIYAKYYSNIPQDVFNQLIGADPTAKPNKMGKYGKWILSLYQRGLLKVGDLVEVKDCLSWFNRYINRIEVKDINKYGSVRELYDVVKPFMENPEQATSKTDALRKQKHEEAEKVYEDSEWMVIVPHTQAASCLYGKGTRWCTAADSSYNMFDYYNNQGKLYININKSNGEKYQFHFESGSFMDAEDVPIECPIPETMGMSEGLLNFYKNQVSRGDYLELFYGLVQEMSVDETIFGAKLDHEKWIYIKSDGTPLLDGEMIFSTVYPFVDGIAKVGQYMTANEANGMQAEDGESVDEYYNFIDMKGNFISKDWFDAATNFQDDVACVYNGMRRSRNLLRKDGTYLLPWGKFSIDPYNTHGLWKIKMLSRQKYNLINADGKLLSPQLWFDQLEESGSGLFTSWIGRVEDDNGYSCYYKLFKEGDMYEYNPFDRS